MVKYNQTRNLQGCVCINGCLGIFLENMILEKGGQIQPPLSLTTEVRIDSLLYIYIFLRLDFGYETDERMVTGMELHTAARPVIYQLYIKKHTIYE